METFVETLARSTYNIFVEFLGYSATGMRHMGELLNDFYGTHESTVLLMKIGNFGDRFDLIIKELGETVRAYPEYKWMEIFRKKWK